MKKQLLFASIFLVTGLLLSTTKAFAQDPNFHVYLCFGQSNMEGSATIEPQDSMVDSRFRVLQAYDCPNLGRTGGTWYTATPPLGHCYAGLSPADYFGRTMIENLPDSIRVGVIHIAIGGLDIRLFDKDIYQDYDSTYPESWFLDKVKAYGGNPYGHLIELAKLAQHDGVIKGILLHQGETNTGDIQWPLYVKTIYNNMLADLSLNPESVPLLAGEVAHADQGGTCARMNPIINSLPDAITTAHVISSSGCTVRPDHVHFNSEGCRELGRRYAELMLSLMGYEAHRQSQVLDYLYSISGKKTLAGQHNKEPNAVPAMWTDYIKETTGKYPALWSGDFLFQQDNMDHRWTMIHEAKKQWDHGAVINLMWHGCPPDQGEPCAWDPGLLNAQLDDEQWKELLTGGTPLNEKWKARMDDLAVYLQYLEDNGVEVLFRPLHEMNQGLFWWGGRPGPEGTAKLYRLIHDYFTDVKGLTSLVWVWDMQDMSRDFEAYNPGDEYWDVFGFDVYDKGYDPSWYEYILPIVGDKPMAIGECSKLPGSDMLASQPRWIFFMPWAELVKQSNSTEEIQALYNDPRIITRDKMPGWK